MPIILLYSFFRVIILSFPFLYFACAQVNYELLDRDATSITFLFTEENARAAMNVSCFDPLFNGSCYSTSNESLASSNRISIVCDGMKPGYQYQFQAIVNSTTGGVHHSAFPSCTRPLAPLNVSLTPGNNLGEFNYSIVPPAISKWHFFEVRHLKGGSIVSVWHTNQTENSFSVSGDRHDQYLNVSSVIICNQNETVESRDPFLCQLESTEEEEGNDKKTKIILGVCLGCFALVGAAFVATLRLTVHWGRGAPPNQRPPPDYSGDDNDYCDLTEYWNAEPYANPDSSNYPDVTDSDIDEQEKEADENEADAEIHPEPGSNDQSRLVIEPTPEVNRSETSMAAIELETNDHTEEQEKTLSLKNSETDVGVSENPAETKSERPGLKIYLNSSETGDNACDNPVELKLERSKTIYLNTSETDDIPCDDDPKEVKLDRSQKIYLNPSETDLDASENAAGVNCERPETIYLNNSEVDVNSNKPETNSNCDKSGTEDSF